MRTSAHICAFMMLCAVFCALISLLAYPQGVTVTVSTKISVLVPDSEARRFESFCNERGYKKSTLIVRLIKEHLDREQYPLQGSLLAPSSTREVSAAGAKKSN